MEPVIDPDLRLLNPGGPAMRNALDVARAPGSPSRRDAIILPGLLAREQLLAEVLWFIT